MLVERCFHCLPAVTARDIQLLQQLLGIHTACGMGAATVHEDAHAAGGQRLGRQQVPGQVAFFTGIARPVQVDLNIGGGESWADGLGEAGELLSALFLMSQQHQEGAELGVLDLAVEQQAHGFAGLLAGQAAGAALALAENAHELGEGVFGGRDQVHRQLVGFGRPASLAASLAGVPLNRRLRCRLLPLSVPSFRAAYLISGRLAGDS